MQCRQEERFCDLTWLDLTGGSILPSRTDPRRKGSECLLDHILEQTDTLLVVIVAGQTRPGWDVWCDVGPKD